MRARGLFAALCFVACCTGCGDGDSGGDDAGSPPAPGDVTFLWTFSDGYVCESPDERIRGMRLDIVGEPALDELPCNDAGTRGALVRDLVPGTYPFTVRAIDHDGVVVYEASSTFFVDGDTTVDVALDPL